MRYTPVELRHVRLSRSLFGGYKRGEADVLLSDVADSFEDVWRERGELADRLEDVEKRLEEIKQRETLLATTLVAAEKTAAEAVESAKREAEIIVAEAHQESRSITRTALNERERLFAEARRVETLLRSALGIVEETRAGEATPGQAEDDASSWPNRENTSEFAAVSEDGADAPQLPPLPAEDEEGPDVPWSGRDFAWG
ncbi:MAG TPA: DivIVA domain-containing protein [Gaiellaceae bacterium]|jgi:cell division septum initiation protein DivIVA|nr:DivIVA domain-containing protein [Gaiellaceae bacterium]